MSKRRWRILCFEVCSLVLALMHMPHGKICYVAPAVRATDQGDNIDWVT